ncbi:hypothetical protein ABQE44_04085 [Mycolicibacterium sp. XJ2546]
MTRGNPPFWSKCVSAVCGVGLVLALTAPSAWPQPGEGGVVADAPSLGLNVLGATSTLAFYGDQGVMSITVPVPRGLVPASVDAVVEMPVNVGSAPSPRCKATARFRGCRCRLRAGRWRFR